MTNHLFERKQILNGTEEESKSSECLENRKQVGSFAVDEEPEVAVHVRDGSKYDCMLMISARSSIVMG